MKRVRRHLAAAPGCSSAAAPRRRRSAALATSHLRLVVQRELAARERPAQLALDRHRVGAVRLAAGVDLERAAALALGLVHGDVGLADQAVEVVALGRIEHDADARADVDLVLVDAQRLDQGILDLACDGLGLLGPGQALDDDRELVAAGPRDRVGVAQVRGEALRDALQHLVAGGVAERVVDLLEAVKVEEQQPEVAAAAPRAQHRLVQPVAEQRPVGQARERVVLRQERQLVLLPPALGDVAEEHRQARFAGVGVDLEPGIERRVELLEVRHPPLQHRALVVRLEGRPQRLGKLVPQHPPQQVLARAPQQPLGARVEIGEAPARVEHEARVGDAGEHALQAPLRAQAHVEHVVELARRGGELLLLGHRDARRQVAAGDRLRGGDELIDRAHDAPHQRDRQRQHQAQRERHHHQTAHGVGLRGGEHGLGRDGGDRHPVGARDRPRGEHDLAPEARRRRRRAPTRPRARRPPPCRRTRCGRPSPSAAGARAPCRRGRRSSPRCRAEAAPGRAAGAAARARSAASPRRSARRRRRAAGRRAPKRAGR